jgi:hypothetical protein
MVKQQTIPNSERRIVRMQLRGGLVGHPLRYRFVVNIVPYERYAQREMIDISQFIEKRRQMLWVAYVGTDRGINIELQVHHSPDGVLLQTELDIFP